MADAASAKYLKQVALSAKEVQQINLLALTTSKGYSDPNAKEDLTL